MMHLCGTTYPIRTGAQGCHTYAPVRIGSKRCYPRLELIYYTHGPYGPYTHLWTLYAPMDPIRIHLWILYAPMDPLRTYEPYAHL